MLDNMAASSSRAGGMLWREAEMWSEPQKVPVLYYLSRNGQLEHPHFMEVPLSSPRGLFLKDVINRLNALRGKGMAFMYSWSCKRSYKNGFVWHDLSENDLIFPAHGHDYILKGSENAFLDVGSPPPDDRRRRNQSCSSIDFEYSVYNRECSSKPAAADVSTQTEIEISPPPSDSSPETLGTLMKADGQVRLRPAAAASSSHRHHHIQRCRSSALLMQLISCGSMPFKDCGTGAGGQGMIGGQHKMRASRGESGGGKLEEKEYFSGSLVETNKREFPALKRSNSYNADRSLNLEVAEKETEKLKAKCIPTKTKAHPSTRKEGSISISAIDGYT
ncbi:protein SOSEKI 5-like [Salvia miltiorrhiza]|uniref:protein SOSEKI 5-like n=1 Tax=Salvia miltiorrhiza TaxID=226208 RepID=UPI0025AC7E25|nr:protein SOSEKI 5-like [Salvia miltiorrhiza]